MNFDTAFDKLLGHEGGYSRHPDDPGGETMWGITARVARANGYLGEMRSMPRFTAKELYLKLYWNKVRADEVPPVLRYPLFDAAVNSGCVQAIKWLQRAVNVGEDGILGPMTLAAAARDPQRTAVCMTAERLDFMTSLPTFGAFGKSWARRIASVLKESTA